MSRLHREDQGKPDDDLIKIKKKKWKMICTYFSVVILLFCVRKVTKDVTKSPEDLGDPKSLGGRVH